MVHAVEFRLIGVLHIPWKVLCSYSSCKNDRYQRKEFEYFSDLSNMPVDPGVKCENWKSFVMGFSEPSRD